jgi:hypothetical protein
VPFPGRLFRLLLERDGEFCFASIGGIVEGFAATVTLRGMEVEAVFNPVRQPSDAGFAVDVGSDFEIQLVGIHESVGDVDADWAASMGRARVIAVNVVSMKKIGDTVRGFLFTVMPTRVRFPVK